MKLLLIILIQIVLFCQEVPETHDKATLPVRINEGHGNYFLVPAGEFLMGDNYEEGNPRERPAHPVYLDDFYIGEFEITNEEYKKFITSGGYGITRYWGKGGFAHYSLPFFWDGPTYKGGGIKGNEKFPVSGVSWFEAEAFCAWLSEETGHTYRLPTEAEWEKAARGGYFLDGNESAKVPNPINPARRYPWGNEIDSTYSNYIKSCDPYEYGPTPVGFYNGDVQNNFKTSNNSSPYGAYDMSGNVYEWCSDFLGYNYYQECLDSGTVSNPAGPETGESHIIRGSAFGYEVFKYRCAYRGAYYPEARKEYIGFRCVREID